ncbi:MAG: nitroreductase family protein [Clostridiales bacterium]|jgi:nitroreductase|nr:nitroreductase family protein [Clostridiales bacterium]
MNDNSETPRNEILNCINRRRSTRAFEDIPLTRSELDLILEAAIWAPSAGNNQSWQFTAVQNKEKLFILNSLVRTALQRWIPGDEYLLKQGAKQGAQREGYNFHYHSPLLLIASNRANYENGMADCALAMENVFIAAESIGLGSCYINHLFWLQEDPDLSSYLYELGIPREHTICSSACIGKIKRASEPRKRKPGTIKLVL